MRISLRVILIVIFAAAVCYYGYGALKAAASTNLPLNVALATVTDTVDICSSTVRNAFTGAGKSIGGGWRTVVSSAMDLISGRGSERDAAGAVRLRLRHGGIIEGTLITITRDSYTISSEGRISTVMKTHVSLLESVTAKEVAWPYRNDVVVVKTDGVVVDGEMRAASADGVTVAFREGSGDVEMTIARAKIDHLLFAPVCTKESVEIERHLKTVLPKLKTYRDGDITLFTDSHETWVNRYRTALKGQHTDIYLNFFRLFKDRKAERQNFVIVFDDPNDFAMYALSDGVPFWLVLGYFDPVSKVLCLYNAFGARMEQMVFDVIVGRTGMRMGAIVDTVKKRIDSRYHIFLEGQAKEITDKFWDVYSLHKTELSEETLETLRHEFTHELFHNWALQSILVSKPAIDRKRLADKKKEFLETKDWKKKEELLKSLMRIQREGQEGIEMTATNSWLAEGVATYSETEPFGGTNAAWLYFYQEGASKGAADPIEFFTNFRMGSFPGLVHEAALRSYGESWALTKFLMDRHHDRFLEYQDRRAREPNAKNKEDLTLLLESLGEGLPALQKEFTDYMVTFPKVDSPYLARFMKYRKVYDDLEMTYRILNHR